MRRERQGTDRAFAKQLDQEGKRADDVLRTARTRAAAVLQTARRRADGSRPGRADGDGVRLRRARTRADKQLKHEYAAADLLLADERAARMVALTKLFLAERRLTDQTLRAERARSDRLLAAREELLAQVSHDLRGLAAAIVLRAMFIQSCKDRSEEVAAAAGAIQDATATMNRLVADLLDAASMDAGVFRVVKEDGRLDVLLAESADALRAAAAEKGISLTLETAASPPVQFDRQRMLQVIANIVGNAIKFTPRGGRISIRLDGAGGAARVSIADTGIGMGRKSLGKVFDRFTQERRVKGAGLGLGLFIARSIVEAHGGKIWVESAPGQGSTFFVTLP